MLEKNKKILCTGSGGFLLSNFIRNAIFTKTNYSFVSIDKVKKNNALNNVYTNKNHKFYIGDVADEHFVNVIFEVERPDIVLHGAASQTDAFVHDNIRGTQSIIDASIKWNVKKLIYVSSDSVYGQLTNEDEAAWIEGSLLAPRSPHAASKAAAELLVQAAGESYGLTYNITRACNTYGPRQSSDKLIPKIIRNILSNQKTQLYGQGRNVRDWINVIDHCDALLKIIANGQSNQIYNISANQEFSNIEVFHEVCKALGRGDELLEFVPDKPGHDFRHAMNITKIKNLGWAPKLKFKSEIGNTVQWYVNNNWWFNLG